MTRCNRTNNKSILAATVAVFVLVGTLGMWIEFHAGSTDGSLHPQAAKGWSYDFTPGLQHRYQLQFEGGGDVVSGEAKAASSVILQSELLITHHGGANGAHSVEYRLENVAHAEIWSNDKELLGGSLKAMNQFTRGSIYLTLGPNGQVRERYISQEFNPVLGQIFELIVAELETVVYDSKTWSHDQAGILGSGSSNYQRKLDSPEKLQLTRTRKRYDSLYALADYTPKMKTQIETQTNIELDPRGFLRSFIGDEAVSAEDSTALSEGSLYDMQWSLSLSYVDSKTGIPALAGSLKDTGTLRKQANRRDVRAMAKRQSLLARAGGLTPQKLRTGLLSSGTLGSMPNHNRWMWQSVALLRLFPELCLEFPGFLDKKAFQDEGKVLLVDLLTSVGHQEAQQALREMLQHPKMQESESYFDFVQRGVFIKEMDATTVEFYRDLQSIDQPVSIQVAASIALGGAAKSLKAAGDHELARELGQHIVDRLDAAEDTTQRSGYIAAMANAQLEEFVPQLLAETHHDAALVRSSAIHALSYSDTSQVRDRLRDLFTDEASAVRAQSLKVFSDKTMDSDDVYNLVDLVEERLLNGGEFYRLLKIASRLKDEGLDAANDLIEAIRERHPKESSVRRFLARLR